MFARFTSTHSLAAALAGALITVACGATQAGATDASLIQARSRAANGSSTFTARCASCHGDRGEGKAYAPSIIGAGALPMYPRDASTSPSTTDPQQLQLQSQTRPPGAPTRAPLRTAPDLHDYLSRHHPDQGTRALTAAELWGVVTFMLVAHGAAVPDAGVTPENAASVAISQ
jgi:cytochrome c553